jgi:hypothetical protein
MSILYGTNRARAGWEVVVKKEKILFTTVETGSILTIQEHSHLILTNKEKKNPFFLSELQCKIPAKC